MVTNEEIAAQLEELGDRLLLEGQSWFKVSAYHQAAVTFRSMTEDVTAVVAQNRLRRIPGVGKAISSKVEAYIETGHIPALDRVRATQSEGMLRLYRETGVAPRRVRALAAGPLGIDSPETLGAAIESGAYALSEHPDARERETLVKWFAGLPR